MKKTLLIIGTILSILLTGILYVGGITFYAAVDIGLGIFMWILSISVFFMTIWLFKYYKPLLLEELILKRILTGLLCILPVIITIQLVLGYFKIFI